MIQRHHPACERELDHAALHPCRRTLYSWARSGDALCDSERWKLLSLRGKTTQERMVSRNDNALTRGGTLPWLWLVQLHGLNTPEEAIRRLVRLRALPEGGMADCRRGVARNRRWDHGLAAHLLKVDERPLRTQRGAERVSNAVACDGTVATADGGAGLDIATGTVHGRGAGWTVPPSAWSPFLLFRVVSGEGAVLTNILSA